MPADLATPLFTSVLNSGSSPPEASSRVADDVLHDLAIDHVLRVIEKNAPDVADAFRTLCGSEEQVRYRQEVFCALSDHDVRRVVDDHLAASAAVDAADSAAERSHDPYVGELWHLDAVFRYTRAVDRLVDGLATRAPASGSAALRGLVDYATEYRSSPGFQELFDRSSACRSHLDHLRYNVLVQGARVFVSATDGEDDIEEDARATFRRFGATMRKSPAVVPRESTLDHVQAWILGKVALVHPAEFDELVRFAADTGTYRDETLERFRTEVWFYLAYLDAIADLREAGLPFCYPQISRSDKTMNVADSFDLSLATRLVAEGRPVVLNDLRLDEGQRILVVSGPNQGGKTTSARTFGQLHYLAGLGCPVPGNDARIFLADQVLTSFDREEQLEDLRGRLGAEIHRVHEMLGRATDRTVLVLNELFSSTALHDARILTRDVLERILGIDAVAVCVTFIDELSRLDEHRTVSMVSLVDPQDPARRTFRVERRAADGRAYAQALAVAHGLTARQIVARVSESEPREESNR